MERIFQYRITTEYDGISINDFLLQQGYSRKLITTLKKTDFSIMVNGKWMYTRDRLHKGELLQISLIEEQVSQNIIPVSMPLDIFYEDEDILVLNKPSNTPIHPSQNNYDNTLANGVISYFNEQGISCVFRCINRLDRDTTGLTIIAKNTLSSCILSKMIKKRQIHREYLAVVRGLIPAYGTITAPIARAYGSTIERCVNFERGEPAITHYRRLSYRNGYALVSIRLETGRTHQIRVHMKHIGHPLPGDFIYNPGDTSIGRQALHSYKLTFSHPITKQPMSFCASLPSDMQSIAFPP